MNRLQSLPPACAMSDDCPTYTELCREIAAKQSELDALHWELDEHTMAHHSPDTAYRAGVREYTNPRLRAVRTYGST